MRTDSPLRSVKELDRPDQVIGFNTEDSVGVWLKQRLSAAKVRETPDYTLRDAVQWLQSGYEVAFAGGPQRLMSGTRDIPGLPMLDYNSYRVPQAIALPLDRADRLQLISATLAELRSNGFLQDSIARSGIEGLALAPADAQGR